MANVHDIFAQMKRPKAHTETHTFKTKDETEAFFKKFRETLKQHTIILLQGKMGTGKSQTAKWLCGIDDSSSPSYALHHSYRDEKQNYEHFDFDRLEDQDDLESMGFWDIFSQTKAIVLVEWPERLNLIQLPFDWPIVTIQLASKGDPEDQRREVIVTNYAALA